MKKFIVAIILPFLLFACNNTEQADMPSQTFSEEYKLSDFKLNDNYLYWEIRQGNTYYQNKEHTVLQKYDTDKYQALSTDQQSRLRSIKLDNGFDASCLPDYCAIYAVAVGSDSFFTIESTTDLLTLFGDIDTEAEVYVYLSTHGSIARSYEKNALGYKVLLAWDNNCGTKGENLVQVYSDGTVEVIQEVNTTEYDGCI